MHIHVVLIELYEIETRPKMVFVEFILTNYMCIKVQEKTARCLER